VHSNEAVGQELPLLAGRLKVPLAEPGASQAAVVVLVAEVALAAAAVVPRKRTLRQPAQKT